MGGGAGWGVMEGMKPVAGMVVVQFAFAGVNIFYKLAVCDGMDMRILVAYRYLFASAVLAPLAYFVERYLIRSSSYPFLCYHRPRPRSRTPIKSPSIYICFPITVHAYACKCIY
jgi:hypothetical protein